MLLLCAGVYIVGSYDVPFGVEEWHGMLTWQGMLKWQGMLAPSMPCRPADFPTTVPSHGQNINTLSRHPNTGHRTPAQGSTGEHRGAHPKAHPEAYRRHRAAQHTHRTGPPTKEEMFRVEIRLTFGL
jgi:hypothetical protein